MLSEEWAREFVEEWITAWNAHDLERILAHYADDFTMSSPFIAQWAGTDSGMLKGKNAVGAYWRTALERVPDLHFTLREICVGADSVAVFYESVLGKLAIEVLFIDADGKAYQAVAHYG